jgi:hypothetical protein
MILKWRTAFVILALSLVLLAGMYLCLRQGGDTSQKLFSDLATALVLLAVSMAGKSSVEHLADGGGVRGAMRSLLTEARPGDAPAQGTTTVTETSKTTEVKP